MTTQPATAMTAEKPTTKPARTPENTPVPGGGRWHWDQEACAWAEVTEPASPVQTAAPITATEPTPE